MGFRPSDATERKYLFHKEAMRSLVLIHLTLPISFKYQQPLLTPDSVTTLCSLPHTTITNVGTNSDDEDRGGSAEEQDVGVPGQVAEVADPTVGRYVQTVSEGTGGAAG